MPPCSSSSRSQAVDPQSDLRELVQLAIDHGRLRFTAGHQPIEDLQRALAPHGHRHQAVERAVQERLGNGDGDVGQKVLGRRLLDVENVPPKLHGREAFQPYGRKAARAEQEAIQIPRPSHGQVGHPGISLAQQGDFLLQLFERPGSHRPVGRQQLHGVLIAVDVMMERLEPVFFEGRQAHQVQRMGQGFPEHGAEEVPGEGRHRIRESLGRLVARIAGLERRHGRDWSRNNRPPSHPHSMSCGQP